MKRFAARMLILAALAGLGLWAWRALSISPEQAVRKQLAALSQQASFNSKESQVAALYNATRLASFFTKEVEVALDIPGASRHTLNGRDELQAAIAAARGMATSVSLQFVDVVVQIGADKKSAAANLTVRGKVSGEPDLVVQELKLFLKEIEGDWLISRVETVKTLQ